MNRKAFKVVIPARYGSTRLPGKPLLDIAGKPMIEWVYRAASTSQAQQVLVATDDERIYKVVKSFAGECCLTSADHQNGTDRIVEVADQMGWGNDVVVVNLQGDEPLMPADNLNQVADNLLLSGYDMATLHKAITEDEAADPDLVKLVCDRNGRALYFSRSKIPFQRDNDQADYAGHIGLYAYRVGFLKTYATLKPCMLEQSEKLEQLRALYYGYSIHSDQASALPGVGVDTARDLEKVTQQILNR